MPSFGSLGGSLTVSQPVKTFLPDSYLGIGQMQRVAPEVPQFSVQFNYGKEPFYFGEITSGAGVATHDPDMSAVKMEVGTASGDRVYRQSHMHLRYQPGITNLIDFSFVGVAPKENLRYRVGAFFEKDGVFFEQSGSSLYFVIRSSATGTIDETTKRAERADWNIDKLDGTGLSGKTLDLTKGQLLIIEYLWLGVGPVRFGFEIDGERIWAHQFNNQDLPRPYMATGNLPLAIEIENTGVTSSPSEIFQICCTNKSQGGVNYKDIPGSVFSITMTATKAITNSSWFPILSIRHRDTVGGKTNYAQIIPKVLSTIATGGRDAIWEAFYNPTLTGASWSNVHPSSHVEFDIAATAMDISNAVALYPKYGEGGRANQIDDVAREIKATLVRLLDGTRPILTIAARTFSAAGNNVAAGINWKELAD